MQHLIRPGAEPRERSPAAVAPQLPPVLDVLEHTSDCVALVDDKWRFTYLNGNAQRVLGRGRNLIGCELHHVFASERGTREWKQTQAAAKAGKSTHFQFFALHLESWFEVDIHPLPCGLQIYFRDLSARRKAEAALATREETLRLALEAVGDAAWDWNLLTGLIRIEGRHVASLGYRRERFDGSADTMKSFIHEADVQGLSNELTNHLAGRSRSFAAQFRVRARSGEWRWTMCRGRVIERDPITGWAVRMVGTSVDIQNLSNVAQRRPKACR
jgi:PAS domain-containing protein